jgi:signal transduction histidine kinase
MRLNKEVNQIGQTEDLSGRVTVSMRDEIGSLSRNINQMLENLEQAQLKRAELFEQVQAGQQNLQRLSRQLVDVQEAERRRLALELHDEIGQNLTGLKLMLEGGASLPDPQMRERMRNSLALVNELIGRVRTLSLELRPAMLDDFGLLPTLMWLFDRYTAQTDIQVDFQHNGLQGERFPAEIETAAYRTIQEALTNSARHSGVQIVYVRAWRHENLLGIQLEDHGAGFDLELALQAGSSSGLIGIRERVSLLGGDFSIETAPGEGTCLTVTFPLQVDLEEMDEHHNSAG